MRKLILILLFFLLIATAKADLVMQPNPAIFQVKYGEETTFNTLQLTNTYNFTIEDFEFSNTEGFTFQDITLTPNQTKTISVKILRNESGSFDIDSVVSFKYTVDIPQGQKTHNINITENGYLPNFLIARNGDTVIWNNLEPETRNIIFPSFSMSIGANQSSSHVFNSVNTIYYSDQFYYSGTVEVINATEPEKVNNPNYDRTLNIKLDVGSDPTELKVENNQYNYTMNPSSSKEGILEIENIGNITAQKIKLTSEPGWINFDENNFDLDVGEKNIVTYHIEPLIFETEETNKTHKVIIKVKAVNSQEYEKNLSVFISYSNVFDNINTNEGFLAFFLRYCQQNPGLIICNNTIQQQEPNANPSQDQIIHANLTASELISMLKRIQRIEDSNSRTNNQIMPIAQAIPLINSLLNQSLELQKENEKISTSRTRAVWITSIFIIIIISIVIIGFYLRRYFYNKTIIDGGFIYK